MYFIVGYPWDVVLIREFVGINNVLTNLMRATNYLGYFVVMGF